MKVALFGQPNCGKSTIFNAVAGYRSATGNFPGTTVRLAWSRVRLNGSVIELVDVPGVYSLTACNALETGAKQFLLESGVDVIVNVVDASLLSRSLELTLELRELGLPMVVCLNMVDEARRKGIEISARTLSEQLGVSVVETIAPRGVGIQELFQRVKLIQGWRPAPVTSLRWHRDIEFALDSMERTLANSNGGEDSRLPARFRAIKLLENDPDIAAAAPPEVRAAAGRLRDGLAASHGREADSVVMSERHALSMHIFEKSATVGRPRPDIRVVFDNLLMHRVWGYVFLLAILLGFFWAVFGLGAAIEQWLQGRLESVFERIATGLPPGTAGTAAVRSLWDGFAGGAVIVLPYLVPFLLGLAFLEDVGYLPRVAYLMDGLLHRIGLHGTSMLPLILGYGCTVPACMATRILPSRRDRFLATVLATLVPCSARSTIIFALVAFYLGPFWALGVFVFNAAVVVSSGWMLTRLWPEVSAGMILEVPRYQWPTLSVLARKVWLRLREFVVISWPLLVGGSLLLGLADHWQWTRALNAGLSPLTWALGLPVAAGTTLIFGILRKELALVMLVQALGTVDVGTVMTATQIVVFTLFLTFYTPCLATIAAMTKEIGKKLTVLALAYTFVLATVVGIAARYVLGIVVPG